MESFEELGVAPELAEALAAEGIEAPTAFQAAALPVLLRGHALLAQAGPGAGTLVAYGIPLLQGVDPEGISPQALVLVPTPEAALRLAQSLARLGQATGQRVAALGSPWALPELASILFATPGELLREVRASRLSVEGVRAVVVDGYGSLTVGAREAVEVLFGILPKEGQRILLSQPMTPEAGAFARAHLHRALQLPPRAAQEQGVPPPRGEVGYRVTGEARESELLQTVAGALDEGVRHVLLFCRTEDQAADAGDFLAIHGYLAGAPGDAGYPVWLGVDEVEARHALQEGEAGSVLVVSFDVPADPDSLDRRHGGGTRGVVLVRSRELPHLRELARGTGYRLVAAREPIPTRVSGELERLRERVERALKEEELAPHYLALEPLFRDHAPAEVAAAALALLQHRPLPGRGSPPAETVAEPARPGAPPPPRSWTRLFMGVGEKDGAGPGDLLGAIAGEAGVEGSHVGKIEIRETFSLVEVTPSVADRIIRAVNGTSIRGRAVRVDYDRGGPRGRESPGGGEGAPGRPTPPRRGAPRRRPRGDGAPGER